MPAADPDPGPDRPVARHRADGDDAAQRWLRRVVLTIVAVIAVWLTVAAIPPAPRPVEGPPVTSSAQP